MTKCYGGIDLGGSFIKTGLLSAGGEPLARFQVPTQVRTGIPTVKANLRQAAARLVDIAIKRELSLWGIGVGSPGTVRYPEGIITGATPNIPGWIGTNISQLFSDLGVPVSADNDANCMGLAEARFGAGKGTSSGLYLTLGTGIGGAVIMNGALVRGTSFAAGEFGHMILKYGGRKCKAGHRGCLEAYANVAGLVSSARKCARKQAGSVLNSKLRNLTPPVIFEAFRKGDRAAIQAVTENAAMVGVAIGSVVNLLNPEVVVIGGGLSRGGAKYIKLIRQNALAYSFASTASILKIRTARFGNDAGWIGAACLNIPRVK